jgi:hypothetical protein
MKQRIYLPTEYAEILSRKAHAAGVSPDLYLHGLILADHICGSAPSQATTPTAQPLPSAPADGIQLSGSWSELSL